MSTAVNLHVLRDSREVLGFGCDCSVEFRHWDTPGCNLGPKHGCWVNDGGCANLHWTAGGAVTLLLIKIFHCIYFSASCPLPLCSCVMKGWSTYHQAEVTHFHLFLHFGQDVRIQSFSKKHHIGSEQPATVSDVTPGAELTKANTSSFWKGLEDWRAWHQRNSFSTSVLLKWFSKKLENGLFDCCEEWKLKKKKLPSQ